MAERRPPRLLDAEQLWEFALKAVSGRALSAGEIREKLRRKAAAKGDVDGVMSRLREYGYVDDARLAESFAAARRDNQGFGRFRVLRDLRQRRVAGGVAQKAVDHAFAGADETEQIQAYLARKYRGRNLPQFLADEKNLASVFRRLRYAGFGAGASIRVLKRYAARAEELSEDEE